MEFLNVLIRDEMNNIKGGEAPWSCECTAQSGCEVKIDRYSTAWGMVIGCTGEGFEPIGNDSGCLGGTACGGECLSMC
ncbi:MAG: hypothetical protein ABJI33_07085 [Balneola sp.]